MDGELLLVLHTGAHRRQNKGVLIVSGTRHPPPDRPTDLSALSTDETALPIDQAVVHIYEEIARIHLNKVQVHQGLERTIQHSVVDPDHGVDHHGISQDRPRRSR